jgi:hypothetical protein
MATERITARAISTYTVYAVVFRLSDGKVFDWADSTWKLIGAPPTTPGVAMTGLVTFATGFKQFAADLNLSTINATMTPVDVVVRMFVQAGGSPAPATDTDLGEIQSFTIVGGQRLDGTSSLPSLMVVVTVDTTTTAGTNSHVKVQVLDQAGQLVNLDSLDPSATCAVDVQRDGVHSQFALSTSDFGAPNANGWFEADYANPAFTTDSGYTAIATIVTGGVTYKGACNFNVWP